MLQRSRRARYTGRPQRSLGIFTSYLAVARYLRSLKDLHLEPFRESRTRAAKRQTGYLEVAAVVREVPRNCIRAGHKYMRGGLGLVDVQFLRTSSTNVHSKRHTANQLVVRLQHVVKSA